MSDRRSESVRRRALRGAVTALVAALLIGAGAVGAHLLRTRYAVPTADLIGDGASPSATATRRPTRPPGANINGPRNFRLVGDDTRESIPDREPHPHALRILHVEPRLDRGYLFSLPRDLLVDIPPFPAAG